MRRLKVVIADDHRLMLEAIRAAIGDDEEVEIVGEADAGSKVLPLIAQTGPDVLLLDLRMPDMDGFAVLERVRARYPQVKVVILSGVDDPAVVEGALKRGATAYLLKQLDPRDLAGSLRQAVAGTIFRPLDLLGSAKDESAARLGLGTRELSILEALQSGGSNRQIGKQLHLAEHTVKFHLTNIYRKFGVSTRTEAVRYAYEHGLADERTLLYVAWDESLQRRPLQRG